MPEYERVRALIQHLQALRGRRLWAYEDATLLQPHLPSAEALRQLVGAMLASIFFESDLGHRWAETALEWLRGAHSRHLACRSHQVQLKFRLQILLGFLCQWKVGTQHHMLCGLHACGQHKCRWPEIDCSLRGTTVERGPPCTSTLSMRTGQKHITVCHAEPRM